MKKIIMMCVCLLLAGMGAQAQEKKKGGFGNFLKKVNKTLDATNQALDDANAALSGKERTVTKTGGTTVISPKRTMKLTFKECYAEGNDVVVIFTMIDTDEKGQGFNWGEATAWDETGQEYRAADITLGGRSMCGGSGMGIPSDVEIKGEMRIPGISKEVNTIKLIKMDSYQLKGFEMRNVTIDREDNNAITDAGTAESTDTKVTSPTRNLKLQFKECVAEGNNLVINFMITNASEEEIGLNHGGGTAYDDQGEAHDFGYQEFTIGGKEVGPTGTALPAGIPLKASITLKNVGSKVEEIKLLKFDTYQFKGFEMRNMTIRRDEQ